MAYGPFELTGELIALIDKRWATVQDVERLLAPLHIVDPVHNVHCFREIKRLIRLVPVTVFADEEQRQNLLDMCQLALDRAIEREESQCPQE